LGGAVAAAGSKLEVGGGSGEGGAVSADEPVPHSFAGLELVVPPPVLVLVISPPTP
jgi:hypothetical protein